MIQVFRSNYNPYFETLCFRTIDFKTRNSEKLKFLWYKLQMFNLSCNKTLQTMLVKDSNMSFLKKSNFHKFFLKGTLSKPSFQT